jgi:hypothetical protein
MRPTIEEIEDEDPLLPRAAIIVESSIAPQAFVSRSFENRSPSTTITFLDSGASDHFFRDRLEFTSYEAIPLRTGKSALSSDGDFAIVGKGTVNKIFRVAGRAVHITFLNALHAPSLAANMVSVSQFDRAGIIKPTPHFELSPAKVTSLAKTSSRPILIVSPPIICPSPIF